MAEIYAPFNTGSGAPSTDSQYTKMGYGMSRPGVVQGYGNEMLVQVGSGTNVTVKPGLFTGFGHMYEITSDLTFALATPPAGANRYTRIVVKIDFAGRTIGIAEEHGNSTAPGAMTQNTTSTWEETLGVAVVTPAGNIASLTVSLDRWATPWNEFGRIGMVDEYVGASPSTLASKLYVLPYGQEVSRWSYEKLWTVMPTQNAQPPADVDNPGSAAPPFHGRKFDGTDKIVLPDYRARVGIGLDDMGQGGGNDASRMTAASVLGNTLGKAAIGVSRVPPHFHGLLPALHSLDQIWHFGAGLGSFFALLYSGHTGLFGSGDQLFRASTLDQMFTDLALDKSGADSNIDDGAHTGKAPNWLEGHGSSQQADSNVPPGILVYKMLRIA